jgi:hypothetical protein
MDGEQIQECVVYAQSPVLSSSSPWMRERVCGMDTDIKIRSPTLDISLQMMSRSRYVRDRRMTVKTSTLSRLEQMSKSHCGTPYLADELGGG